MQQFIRERIQYYELYRINGIEFIASHKWNEIEYIQNSGDVNGYNNSELL